MTATGDFKVTLLGTGVPIPSHDRFGPATLIEAGDQKLLIDAGRGASIRLNQLRVPKCDSSQPVSHTSGMPDVWSEW